MADNNLTIENSTHETWKPIPEYEEFYSVSDCGNVRRDAIGGSSRPGRILKPVKLNNGYLVVTLCKNGTRKIKSIHRLVAMTFLKKRANAPQVNHKDGIKINNQVGNLEYVTHQENSQHAVKLGLTASGLRHGKYTKPESIKRGSAHGRSKTTDEMVIRLREMHATNLYTRNYLAKLSNLSPCNVSQIIRRRIWKHV
jgi:hypothetical protein